MHLYMEIKTPINLNFFIYHSTHISNLGSILRNGILFDQISRISSNERKIVIGEGNSTRKLCKHNKRLSEIEHENCEEAIGVYFRLAETKEEIPEPKRNQAIIILDANILSNYDWHLNYCENNGFFIYEGENKAYFGNEDMHCPASTMQIDWNKVDPVDSEILVHKSVDIMMKNGMYLVDIVTKKMKENVKTKKMVPSLKHKKYTSLLSSALKTRINNKPVSLKYSSKKNVTKKNKTV